MEGEDGEEDELGEHTASETELLRPRPRPVRRRIVHSPSPPKETEDDIATAMEEFNANAIAQNWERIDDNLQYDAEQNPNQTLARDTETVERTSTVSAGEFFICVLCQLVSESFVKFLTLTMQ